MRKRKFSSHGRPSPNARVVSSPACDARLSPRALSSCWTRFSPLIMHLRVHLSWIAIVAPPSDITISHVSGAGVPGNGAATIGIIEAVIARFFTSGQQSLAMLFDKILNLSAGQSERIGGG